GVELVAFDTEVDEAGETYSENARLKAEAALSKSGLPSLGDDSGLEVEALGGFPGLKSARLGPTQKERTAELLRRLQGVPRPWKARFVCVIALAVAGRDTRFFEGECRGEVVPEWRGGGGFGFGPIFLGPGKGKAVWETAPQGKGRERQAGPAGRAPAHTGGLSRRARR